MVTDYIPWVKLKKKRTLTLKKYSLMPQTDSWKDKQMDGQMSDVR